MISQEERDINEALGVIKNNKREKDQAIKFLKIKIGLYRVEAEKYSGYMKSTIHKMANDLEKKLSEAITS